MSKLLFVFLLFSSIIGFSAESYVIVTGTVIIDQSYVDQNKIKHEKFVTYKYFSSSMEIDLEEFPKDVVEQAYSNCIDKKHKEKKTTKVTFQSFATKDAAKEFYNQLIKEKEGIKLNLLMTEIKRVKDSKEKK